MRRAGPLTTPAARLAALAALLTVVVTVLITRAALEPAPWIWLGWPLLWVALGGAAHHHRAKRQSAPR